MNQPRNLRMARIAATVLLGGAIVVGTSGVAIATASTAGAGSHARAPIASVDGRLDVRFHHHHHYGYWRTHHGGRISALTSSSVTIKRNDGVTATYATTSSTTYFEGAAPTTAAALALGEAVDLVLTPTAPQAIVKLTIEVVHLSGTVSAVTGAAITIGPSAHTVVTSSSTTFTYGNGTAATLADVLVGDTISAKGVNTPTAGTIDANSVVIYPVSLSTHVGGRISALTSSSVTIKRNDGVTATYATTSSTTYFEGAAPTTAAALALGEAVDLVLTPTAPQAIVKLTIEVVHLSGTVSAVTGAAITIGPSAHTVVTSSSTTFTYGNGTAATLADVLVGDTISAKGVNTPTAGTIDANSVVIYPVSLSTHVGGRISALTSSSVTIKRNDGVTATYATTSSTTYFEGAAPTTAAALALGEAVDLVLTPTAPQAIVKLTIEVVHLSGTVSAVTGAAITIGPSAHTVVTSSSTTFTYGNGTAATLADVLVGDTISAKGVNTPTAGTIDANSVVIYPVSLSTHVGGRITALGSSSVTIKRNDGATATYATTSSTTYFEGAAPTTAAALALGEAVDLVLTPTAPQAIVKLTIEVVHLSGTVSGVTGAAITIGPSAHTVVTSSSTTFTYGNGTAATLADVLVGDTISAKGVNTPTAGTIDANSVVIYPVSLSTHVGGRITALGSSSVTIKRNDGATATYATTSSTTYFEGAAPTTAAALALGEAVDLVLTPTAPQAIVKLTIEVVKFTGVVIAVSGNTITLSKPSGKSEVVTVTASTAYTLSGGGAAILADVLVGDQLSVTGVNGVGDQTITASSVVIGSRL